MGRRADVLADRIEEGAAGLAAFVIPAFSRAFLAFRSATPSQVTSVMAFPLQIAFARSTSTG